MFAIYIIHQNLTIIGRDMTKENRTYIRGEFRESVGMNFFSPFQSEREFEAVAAIRGVIGVIYPPPPRILGVNTPP